MIPATLPTLKGGTGAARILVVDDNPANVQLLEMLLTRAGYASVTGLTDPRQVVPLYEQNPFDLILLDIRMPHMSGFDVMAALRQVVRDDYLPILVLTAQTDMETRLKALELGAKDFVNKPFDQAEVLNRIANMLEVRALYNERRRQNEVLEGRVRERTAELEETRLEVIRRLARAGEYRDNETGMHVVRMSKYCERMALGAGLGERFARHILVASPMHDVGKIGIPDNILLKPGKLDPEERRIMETHVIIGADIIGDHPAPELKMARNVAMTHHEKWNGNGYPNRLKGDKIPIEGRICAISDVFDALTSERPYKKGWPLDKAIAFVRENAGSHFDPDLVAVFDQVLPDIMDLRSRYADGPEHDMDSYRALSNLAAARVAGGGE